MPIRGVLFDVDDTLFDYTGSERAGILAHLRHLGLLHRFPDPRAAALWREVTDEQYARFLAGELTFTGQQRERARRFLARLGESGGAVTGGAVAEGGMAEGVTTEGGMTVSAMTDEAADTWFAGYTAHRDAAQAAFPDAAPVLAALAATHRLGIVSNSSTAQQRRKLHATGLLHHFPDTAIVCSDEHGEAKPAPGIFLAACARLGLPPEHVAHVGDDYALDALGARRAGLHPFWLDRAAAHPAPPDPGIRVLHTLTALPAALRA
ncbi:HAD family hydrolase [Kitasatospora sp. NPDC056783]|uniref:HAD family hydrolase n=1 Tax=Kitasatospora sp. NPDC056783 TaxID=3345943 RepID=UPI0036CC08D3